MELAKAHVQQVQSLKATSILSTLMYASAAALVLKFAQAKQSLKVNPQFHTQKQLQSAFLTFQECALFITTKRIVKYYSLATEIADASKAFTPNTHFTFSYLDSQLPSQTANIPEPIVVFGTMTFDEAATKYKNKDYFTGVTSLAFQPNEYTGE